MLYSIVTICWPYSKYMYLQKESENNKKKVKQIKIDEQRKSSVEKKVF